MRIRQKAYIKHIVRIDRDPVFEAKRFEHHGQFTLTFTQQAGAQHLGQFVNRHLGGVDNQVSAGTQRFQQITLFVNSALKR